VTRFQPTRVRGLAGALMLGALLAAPTRSLAQTEALPTGPIDRMRHHLSHWAEGFHAERVAIPRTYSYYYATWFNQPCHSKYVGPDGHIYWRTTVRGLPLGTPWPSYGPAGLP
jgi:hypothetical protein